MKYKNKYYLFLAGIPLLLLLSWNLSISQTVNALREYSQIKSNHLRYADPMRTLEGLRREFSSIHEGEVVDPDLLDQQLMEVVSKKAGPYNIQLEAFPETHSYLSDNYQVQTFKLRFSGRYANLLRFIHYAENEIKSCRMISVAFERKVHRKSGERLYADLYFQSVYKIN